MLIDWKDMNEFYNCLIYRVADFSVFKDIEITQNYSSYKKGQWNMLVYNDADGGGDKILQWYYIANLDSLETLIWPTIEVISFTDGFDWLLALEHF